MTSGNSNNRKVFLRCKIDSDLKKKLKIYAVQNDFSLDEAISKAIDKLIEESDE